MFDFSSPKRFANVLPFYVFVVLRIVCSAICLPLHIHKFFFFTFENIEIKMNIFVTFSRYTIIPEIEKTAGNLQFILPNVQ